MSDNTATLISRSSMAAWMAYHIMLISNIYILLVTVGCAVMILCDVKTS